MIVLMAENFVQLSAAHPACKLIVRTFEESKFHAHTIMIKFGVEITTAHRAALAQKSGRKPKREALFSVAVGGQEQLWGSRKWATHSATTTDTTTAAEVDVRRGAGIDAQ